MSDNNPFNILNTDGNPQSQEYSAQSDQGMGLNERIEKILGSDNLVLFMKGNPSFPQCGFSANSVAILNNLGAKYTTFDILQDMDIRQGLKEYSQWPTFPQLYIKGELIGGNDIITELFQAGELKKLVDQASA